MSDMEAREAVREILRPLVDAFADRLAGATEPELQRIAERFGAIPAAVEEYLRIMGGEPDVCSLLFAGLDPFGVSTLIHESEGWFRVATDYGASSDLLTGAIPYTGSDEWVTWLGPDAPGEGPGADPAVWSVVAGDQQQRLGVFTEDLVGRVATGLARLDQLRERVDAGFPDPMFEATRRFADEDTLVAARREAELRLESWMPGLSDKLERMRAAVRDRETALRRRLVE